MKTSVAILGASGYTGAELLRLISAHPRFSIDYIAAHSQAGKKVCEVLPGFASPLSDAVLAHVDDPLPQQVELVFTALPHGASANVVEACLQNGKRVVDLSADFRHADPANYEAAYGQTHPYPERLTQTVYGLSEFVRDKLPYARLVGNPGCYPTSVLLALVPLLRSGLVDAGNIIIDSKSGASGAGRATKTELLFCDLDGGLAAYGLPRHRHVWEMEELAEHLGGQAVSIRFVPHILPMKRGMLSTLHLRGRQTQEWHGILAAQFEHDRFVQVLPEGRLPSTHAVAGSNRCDIGVSLLGPDTAVVVSCLDNLLKGAAGQALQNANLMYGWDESLGLSDTALWP